MRYFLIIFAMAFGLFIYLVCRDIHTPFYNWTVLAGCSGIVDQARQLFSSTLFPDWFIYSLPDGLWMFAFVLFTMAIWDFRFMGMGRIWIIFSVFLGISFEICQSFIQGMGTFDWVDMTFIFVGALIPILMFTKLHIYEKVR
ncbi:MAG: hypothetical protein KA161_12565 [Saprospiraceae bacterium]|nr:hypothetical protein [Saprospiraceae bacterium]